MKKTLIIFLLGLITVLFAFGCGQKEEPQTEMPAEEPAKEVMEDTTAAEDTTSVMEEAGEEAEEAVETGN